MTDQSEMDAPERILMDPADAEWFCAKRFPDNPEDSTSIEYVRTPTITTLTAERDALREEVERLKLVLAGPCSEAVGRLSVYDKERSERVGKKIEAALKGEG